MNGFLLVDKPAGLTSFDVVRRVKRVFKTKKVGHAGTLDPDASGLLLIAVNNATRLLRFLDLEPKTYTFEIVLGVQTNTDDAVGKVVAEAEFDVSLADVELLVPSFSGKIMQRPPLFSALHIDGKRAYKKARDGEEFEMPERGAEVFSLSLLSFEDGVIQMEASVSSGTYIRSIARDFGVALGTIAHARKIRRTRLSNYDVKDASSVGALSPEILKPSMPILCASISTTEITASELSRVRKGMAVNIDCTKHEIGAFVGIICESDLVGVAEVIFQDHYPHWEGRRIQPRVMFPE